MALVNDQAGALILGTSASTDMYIDSDGDVGIGTDNPLERLHVYGNTGGTSTQGWARIQGNGTSNDHTGWIFQSDAKCYSFAISHSNSSSIGANLFYWWSAAGTMMTLSEGGNLSICGSLSKNSGSFRIEHPLESKKDTHELVHSFTESPQADLLYSGWTQLTSGAATINIDTIHDMTDGTFVALNRCIRVFTSNESDWDMVRGSVTGNQLTIESNNASSVACVSWLVIGERCDKHMMDR